MKKLLMLCCSLVLLTGCATLSGSGPERIPVDSIPTGADVSVKCEDEGVVATGVTPTSVLVPRSAEDCIVTISKAGYTPHDVPLESGMNPRFWLNLPLTFAVPVALIHVAFNNDSSDAAAAGLGLGAIGFAGMIIDSVTDAKRDHDPKQISVTLAPSPP